MSEKEKILPIGLGSKIESKEKLPAIEVANEVIWVNRDFPEMPFDLQKGKTTNLGLFLTPESKIKKFLVEADWRHGRSALLGRVIFKDKQGNFYRDVDLKGIGSIICWSIPKTEVGEVMPYKNTEESWGIFDKADAIENRDWAEKFIKAGIRAERFLAIIELKEIIDKDGNKISIEEARKREMINKKIVPVLGLRAFGCKSRIVEADEKTKIEDARIIVAQELGIDKDKFLFKDYLEWFAKALGKNIGLMHKNNWAYPGLSSHNLTLDCRIVDLDEVEEIQFLDSITQKVKMEGDYSRAENNLRLLVRRTLEDLSEKDLNYFLNLLTKSYIKNLGFKPDFIKI